MVRYTEGKGLCSHCRADSAGAECAVCYLRVCDACSSNPSTCSQPKTVRHNIRRSFFSKDRVLGTHFEKSLCLIETLSGKRLVYDFKNHHVAWISKRPKPARLGLALGVWQFAGKNWMDSQASGIAEGVWLDGLTNAGEMVQVLRSAYTTNSFILLDGTGKKTTVIANLDGRTLMHGFSANSTSFWTLQSNDTVAVVNLETNVRQVYDPLPRQALRGVNVDFKRKRIAAVTFDKVAIYFFGESLTLETAMRLEREPCGVLIHGGRVVVEFIPTFDSRRTLVCYRIEKGKLVEEWRVNLEEQPYLYSALAFQDGRPSPKGEIVIHGGASRLTLLSLQAGKATSLNGDKGRVDYAGFSPDGNTLATASGSHLLVRERGSNGFNQPIVDA